MKRECAECGHPASWHSEQDRTCMAVFGDVKECECSGMRTEQSATVDGALLCGVDGELTDADIAAFREVVASARKHFKDNDTTEMQERRRRFAERRAERNR